MGIVLWRSSSSELFFPPSAASSQESTEEEGDQDLVILPERDPDVGMPADQAEIHGIEWGCYPVTTISLDNINERVPVVKD